MGPCHAVGALFVFFRPPLNSLSPPLAENVVIQQLHCIQPHITEQWEILHAILEVFTLASLLDKWFR